MMKWHVIDTGIATAEKNMAIDEGLIHTLRPSDQPILRLYEWQGDCATYGYFTKPEDFLNLENVSKEGLSLAKRSTGGGIVFHFCDYAFSALLPAQHPNFSLNTLENYAFINQFVQRVVCQFLGINNETHLLPEEPLPLDESSRHFCMAKPTKYDVMLESKKVGGASQRRTKNGYLHQGTISLFIPGESYLDAILKPDTCVKTAMLKNSYPLLGPSPSQKELQEARQVLRTLLIKEIKTCV